ncbi:helix-turn-helix domain-containing protein [Segetibacter koreensis]|uniref:helix-turn-helix domain-containing protein n=1 Tax=Segetibacter koreensis TaxID=398037 RepID=UPI00036078F1|nr:AraC family transcriptional regulator [Segetibacter koreensis]
MVVTTEILPCNVLQSFVRCYTLREFNTFGTDLAKPLPANHESSIAFVLSGSVNTNKITNSRIEQGTTTHIIGLQTESKGIVISNGDVKLFAIQFKPTGFHRIFGIPMPLIINNIFEASDLVTKGIEVFNERLSAAKDLFEMKKLADKFLLSQLTNYETNAYDNITSAASVICKTKGNTNIKNLAYEANMSLKSFEMKFKEQVGISPKLFARIVRFNYALMVKMKNPFKTWIDISNDCGYYDQMHFIREFKEFAGNTPASFYKETPLPFEDFRKEQQY